METTPESSPLSNSAQNAGTCSAGQLKTQWSFFAERHSECKGDVRIGLSLIPIRRPHPTPEVQQPSSRENALGFGQFLGTSFTCLSSFRERLKLLAGSLNVPQIS
jgi:hypothetical protein